MEIINSNSPFNSEVKNNLIGNKDGKIFLKIIISIVFIAAAVFSIPFVFCGIVLLFWFILRGNSNTFIIGFIFGGIGVIVVFYFVGKIIHKMFKKK